MTLKARPASQGWFPNYPYAFNSLLSSQSDLSVTNAGDAYHLVGYCYMPGGYGTSKTISAAGGGKIYWLAGARAFNNGSTNLQIGIQDTDFSTGAPQRGDGTFDVSKTLVGGTDTINATALNTTTMASGSKTVTYGDSIAIVFKLTAKGGADTVAVRSAMTTVVGFNTVCVTKEVSGPTYTGQVAIPCAVIQFDDGTFGTLDGGFVSSTGGIFTANDFQASTTPFDEFGSIFTLDQEFGVDALGFMTAGFGNLSNSIFDLVLVSDPLGTPSVVEALSLSPKRMQTSNARWFPAPLGQVRICPPGTYFVGVRATGSATIRVYTFDVNAAGWLDLLDGGTAWRLGKRVDGSGVYTEVATSRALCGIRIAQTHDGNNLVKKANGLALDSLVAANGVPL